MKPPAGAFSVWQRLLRGYGPLAVFVIVLVLMSLLVPSKAPKTTTASNNQNNTGTGPRTTATTAPGSNTGAGAGAGTDQTGGGGGGGGEGGGGGGGGGGAAVVVPGCDQVPGDKYSPPCVQWDPASGNAGATAHGVTDTNIDVAFRVLNEKGFQQTLAALAGATLVDTPETVKNTVSAMADYFNQNFQFYGRKINIRFYDGVGSNTAELVGGGVDKAEADATRVSEEIQAFADISATSEPYGGALAARSVLAFGVPYLSREWHESRRPYAWSLATDCTKLAETVGKYTAARLTGTADFAGGPLKGQPRKILGIAPENQWYQDCIRTFETTATAGGANVVGTRLYKLDLGQLSTQAPGLVSYAKDNGITTIVCGCDPIMPVFLSGDAAKNGYLPEFINIGAALTDFDIVGQLWDQNFTSHAFGISAITEEANAQPTDTVGYEAFQQVRPGQEPAFSVNLIYAQMYMLAIGLQLAGPNLTPETFEQGMFSFPPKPGTYGLWGFGPGDYTPQDDVREIYWDPNGVSPYNGKPGTWVDPNGQRYQNGEFPKGQPPIPPTP